MPRHLIRIGCLIAGLSIARPSLAQQQQPPQQEQPAAAQAPTNPPQPAGESSDQAEAHNPLAERFVEVAQDLLPPADRALQPAVARQMAALLEGAMRLDPNEPRYPRMLADAYADVRDVEGQIRAWTAYRKLVPDDRVAQVRIIELYAQRIETADKQIEYFKDLLTKANLAPEVKAHIAALAAPLLEQRSRAEASAMLDLGRQFYPLPEILRLQYTLLPPETPPAKRVAALLDMLKANPAQPDALADVGHYLSDAGLCDDGATWYSAAINYDMAVGTMPTHSAFTEYVADLYQINQNQAASQGVERMLQVDPNDADGWFLKLTIGGSAANTPDVLAQARTAFTNRVNAIGARIMEARAGGPTTQPAPATQPAAGAGATTQPGAPDVATVTARLKDLKDPSLDDAWISACSDLAWFELCYATKPADAVPWINAIKLMLPTDNPVVERFNGWLDLANHRDDEARQQLAAAREHDPLAALGLFNLEQQQKHASEASAIARDLLSKPRAGVLGAILYRALKSANVDTATTQPVVSEIQTALQQFPRGWLDVLSAPNRFYILRAEPIRIAHRLGEPMFGRVTIQNIGKQDLTIGNGNAGLLQPQLWFDAALRGVAQQVFPGIAADRIMSRTVLHPQESITQVVRIDQRELGQVLRQVPIGMLSIEADVLTNPMPTQGEVRCAPGGMGMRFTRIFSQNNEALNSNLARQRFLQTMDTASPTDKILDTELLWAYARRYLAKDADPATRGLGAQYLEVIQHERTDPDPNVAAWAGYMAASLVDPSQQLRLIEEMTAAQASWESRMLGLAAAARLLPMESQRKVESGLAENDSDPMVKAFATASLDALEHATTQPATMGSTTAPSTAPAQ